MDTLKLNIDENNRIFLAPQIYLNAVDGYCLMSGYSLVSNPVFFYRPVFDWIDAYHQHTKKDLLWDIRLSIINSASQKALITLLKKLKEYLGQGLVSIINWYCSRSDIDLIEDIQDIASISEMEIKIIYTS